MPTVTVQPVSDARRLVVREACALAATIDPVLGDRLWCEFLTRGEPALDDATAAKLLVSILRRASAYVGDKNTEAAQQAEAAHKVVADLGRGGNPTRMAHQLLCDLEEVGAPIARYREALEMEDPQDAAGELWSLYEWVGREPPALVDGTDRDWMLLQIDKVRKALKGATG